MIPVSLRLSNFTSYGEDTPKLDFTGFHLAVLSGRNGAGKSSILDAITWCVWGTSRAGDNSDKLIKHGASQMKVEFEFDLDGSVYKIMRSRATKGGGLTRLDFYCGENNLTEGTIKATQEKIIRTLHLTYETFTNSSFLRQGNADEFTVKGATDRKRILAEILDLKRYDLLEEKAKEKAKELNLNIEAITYSIQEIENELSQKEARQVHLSRIEQELKLLDLREKEAEAKLKEVRAQGEVLSTKLAALDKIKERANTLNEEIESLKRQKLDKEISVKDYQVILAQEEVINKNAHLLEDLTTQAKQWQAKEQERNSLQDKIRDLEKKAEETKGTIKVFESKMAEIKLRGQGLRKDQEALKESEALCPTCGQTLKKDSQQHAFEELQKKIDEELKEFFKLKDDKEKLELNHSDLQSQISPLEEKLESFKKEFTEYEKIQQKIEELKETEHQKIKLSEAKGKIEAESKTLADLEQLVKAREETIAKEASELKDYDIYKTQLVEKRNEYQTRENSLKEIRDQNAAKMAEKGAAKELVDRATQLEQNIKDKLSQKEQYSLEKQDYEELALAFGKKGIQAMIIENAIPEIEAETNTLLDQLTDSRMRVEFLTQREAKSGSTIETLDIIISDENGSRSYEMYSGGEAFRVNFAIRLALSKLLTHRAGAKLQFLVIDEGFGTQDTEGRDRMVEAINAIKNQYAKILVVTHVEELKEAFPNQIVVTKNATGSTFEVVG